MVNPYRANFYRLNYKNHIYIYTVYSINKLDFNNLFVGVTQIYSGMSWKSPWDHKEHNKFPNIMTWTISNTNSKWEFWVQYFKFEVHVEFRWVHMRSSTWSPSPHNRKVCSWRMEWCILFTRTIFGKVLTASRQLLIASSK